MEQYSPSQQTGRTLNVVSLVWHVGDLENAQAETIQSLGFNHSFLAFNAEIPRSTDIVIAQGPYGPLSPFVHQLCALPPDARPLFVYWFQQSLDLRIPRFLQTIVNPFFSGLRNSTPDAHLAMRVQQIIYNRLFANSATRLGYLGDLFWMHAHGLPDLLVLSSTVYAKHLATMGMPSLVVARGYHPSYGRLLHNKRDIPAVWMGKLRTRRRRAAVFWLQQQLAKHGLEMYIIDGVTHRFIFGKERTELLNRAWFVLNIWFSDMNDELSIRYFIAGANGAVVLTEPGNNIYPFIPNHHLVERPIHEMPDAILYYIEHPKEWQRLSENMTHLLTTELTLRRSLEQVMAQAQIMLEERRG